MPRRRQNNGKISVFKGRKARLNHSIFQILALEGPQTIYDLHKTLKTKQKQSQIRYSSLNKRVRSLEDSGYVKKIGAKKTRAGFEATIYNLTARADILLIKRDSQNKVQQKTNT